MTTLSELINAINEEPVLITRCDDFLYTSARRTDTGDNTNANALMVEALNILRDNPAIRDDMLISQIAFEFVRMGQMNRAGNAVNYIADQAIKDDSLSRMAIERAKTNTLDAVNIAQAISNEANQEQTLEQVAINVAIAGDLTTARAVVATIADASFRASANRKVIRESSKGL